MGREQDEGIPCVRGRSHARPGRRAPTPHPPRCPLRCRCPFHRYLVPFPEKREQQISRLFREGWWGGGAPRRWADAQSNTEFTRLWAKWLSSIQPRRRVVARPTCERRRREITQRSFGLETHSLPAELSRFSSASLSVMRAGDLPAWVRARMRLTVAGGCLPL